MELRRLHYIFGIYRGATLTLAFIFLRFVLPEVPSNSFFIFSLAVFFNVILFFFYTRNLQSPATNILLIIFDVFLAGWLLWSMGGLSNPYYLYSFSPIFMAILYFRIYGAIVTSFAVVSLYLAAGYFNNLTLQKIAEMKTGDIWLANILGYFFIGFFVALMVSLIDEVRKNALRTERTKETLMNVTTALNLANKQLFILQKISLESQMTSNAKEILNFAFRGITKDLGFEFAVIGLLDEGKSFITNWVTSLTESKLKMSKDDLYYFKVPLSEEAGVIFSSIQERKVLYLENSTFASSKYKFLFEPENLSSFAVVPMVARNTVVGVMMIANPRTHQPILLSDTPFWVALGTTVGVAVLNARLYEQQLSQIEVLSSVYKAAAIVSSNLEIENVLNSIVDQIKKVIRSEKAILLLFSEGEESLQPVRKSLKYASMMVRGSRGEHPERWWRKALEELSEKVAQTQSPEIILHKETKKEISWEWLLVVPLIVKGGSVGVISAINSYEHPFTESDISILTILGNLAAVAIENAKLAEKMKKLTIIEERNRIAQEMHDGLAQSLFSLVLNLQACIKRLEIDPQSTKERLLELQKLASRDLKGVRQYIYELRPSDVEELGLIMAFRRYVDGLSRINAIPIKFSVKGKKMSLPVIMEENLFRAAQEAVGNALKHANPKNIEVGLNFKKGKVNLYVEDKGTGFDVESVLKTVKTEGKLGLIGLKERVEKMGGKVEIKSFPEQGTRVEIEVFLNV